MPLLREQRPIACVAESRYVRLKHAFIAAANRGYKITKKIKGKNEHNSNRQSGVNYHARVQGKS
jgi:hypothetical protein